MSILIGKTFEFICQGITGNNVTFPLIRHPSEGWGPALAAQRRDASLRWHDGVGRLEFSHSYTYTV